MKQLFRFATRGLQLLLAFTLAAVVPLSASAQSAEVQLIHNAPNAGTVDVFFLNAADDDSILGFKDVEFRTYSNYQAISLPSASFDVKVGFAVAGTNATVDDTLFTVPLTLNDGDTLVAIASGELAGTAQGTFTVAVTPGKTAPTNASDFEFQAFHGSPDAPTVDVLVQDGATNGPSVLGGAFSFGQFSTAGYVDINDDVAINLVNPAAGNASVERFYVPFNNLEWADPGVSALNGVSLDGLTGVVLASGYLNPTPSQASLGLFVAPSVGVGIASANGFRELIRLPNARVIDLVHVSPDPAADSVDVYINQTGELAIDDLNYLTHTDFISLPITLSLDIAAGNSTDNSNPVASNLALPNDNDIYYLVATGVLNPANFAANPNGVSTAFGLEVLPAATSAAANQTEFDFRFFHGGLDAPAVDLQVINGPELVSDYEYRDADAGYTGLPAQDYLAVVQAAGVPDATPQNLAFTAPGVSNPNVAGYTVPLEALGLDSLSGLVVATGFLDQEANGTIDRPFIVPVFVSGITEGVPLIPAARVQVIHNAADPALETVDAYYNNQSLADNFGFRTALPYVYVNGSVFDDNDNVLVGVANDFALQVDTTSTDTVGAPLNQSLFLRGGRGFQFFANGVVNPADFAANPNGRSIGVDLLPVTSTFRYVADPTNVNDTVGIRVFHGATDAPAIDAEEVLQGFGDLAVNAEYSQSTTGYTFAPKVPINVAIFPTGTSDSLAKFGVDLAALDSTYAFTVFASGFLDPSANQSGPGFGLFAVLGDGTVLGLDALVGLQEELADVATINRAYPNPASDRFTVELALDQPQPVQLRLRDFNGRIVQTRDAGTLTAGPQTLQLNVADAPSGLYVLELQVGETVGTTRLVVSH